MSPVLPLSVLLSQVLIAHTIELDNEFERRFAEAGGGARVTSLTMWTNLLRFVGDGTTVGGLVAASGGPKAHALSRLGGVERWGYVSVGPGSAAKRDGYGSARGLKDDWAVWLTSAGERAAAIWPELPAEIETRWRKRFGAAAIADLGAALRRVDATSEMALPDYLPVVGGANGFALELPAVQSRPEPEELPLVTLLAHALMDYTHAFEQAAVLSLPLSANVARVLGDEPVPARELPALTGIAKEAVEVSLTTLAKTTFVRIEGAPASKRTVRLTAAGKAQRADEPRLHSRCEARWAGADHLRLSLSALLDHPELSVGLIPPTQGWRAGKGYAQQTEAVCADPRGRLPQHPMVLHRGGWPDGS